MEVYCVIKLILASLHTDPFFFINELKMADAYSMKSRKQK